MDAGNVSVFGVGYTVDVETSEMLESEAYGDYWDDISGAMLPKSKVKEARQLELEFLRKFPVHKKVPASQGVGQAKVGVR